MNIFWNGVGLPPVGLKIEAKHKSAQPDWARPGFYETVIVAIGKQLVIFEDCGSGHETVGKLSDYLFRPIRTAEQVKAEERVKAIEEMVYGACGCEPDGGNTSAFIVCGLLYDAGYRKQVQP